MDDQHWSKSNGRLQAHDFCEKRCRCLLVAAPDDRMVKLHVHGTKPFSGNRYLIPIDIISPSRAANRGGHVARRMVGAAFGIPVLYQMDRNFLPDETNCSVYSPGLPTEKFKQAGRCQVRLHHSPELFKNLSHFASIKACCLPIRLRQESGPAKSYHY